MQSLAPIWPSDRPHLSIDDIRDWFASYVYLPRLRDEATLDGALQRLVENLADPFAYASAFDEESCAYEGVMDGRALMPGHFTRGDTRSRGVAQPVGYAARVPAGAGCRSRRQWPASQGSAGPPMGGSMLCSRVLPAQRAIIDASPALALRMFTTASVRSSSVRSGAKRMPVCVISPPSASATATP